MNAFLRRQSCPYMYVVYILTKCSVSFIYNRLILTNSAKANTKQLSSSYQCFHFLAKCLSDSDFPQNAAVLAGQQTTMNCRSEGDVWWKYKSKAENMKEIVLFKEGNFSADCERCTINSTEPKQFDLIVNNTRLSDAGTYSCVEILENTTNHSETARHYSELIVFGRSFLTLQDLTVGLTTVV